MSESFAAGLRGGDRPWPSWVDVDLDAVAHNLRSIQGVVGHGCRVAAVVKAQAYGHGAVMVARAALEAGACLLAVARVREGVQLRRAGIAAPILVLGPARGAEAVEAVEHGLMPTVISVEQLREFSTAAVSACRELSFHLKIGTGLNRFGIALEEARELLSEARGLAGVRLDGIYSHFATADESDLSFAREQHRIFAESVAALRAEGVEIPTVHMAASAATMALPESRADMVRLGISLYGVYPATHLKEVVNLRPALSWHSRIERIFDLAPGDSVGYGRTFLAERAMRVGLVPVGYADGLPRSHSNRGAVIVNGRRAPLLGRVSMDQCVVDLSEIEGASVFAPVVLIGAQAGETIDIDQFASLAGTISYEALTSLGFRVPRVYLRGGSPVAVAHLDDGEIVEAALR